MSVTPKTLATELFIDPWKRLKYGFLPVRRVVDEDFSSNSNFGDEGLALESEAKIDEVEESDIEYRDEANRRWWNFSMKESTEEIRKSRQKILGTHGSTAALPLKKRN